jgi:hypothetical protein
MKHQRKIAAAVAAVTAYIKSEEEAICLPGAPAVRPKPLVRPNLWGASGRASMMQVRSLMQLKTFHRR